MGWFEASRRFYTTIKTDELSPWSGGGTELGVFSPSRRARGATAGSGDGARGWGLGSRPSEGGLSTKPNFPAAASRQLSKVLTACQPSCGPHSPPSPPGSYALGRALRVPREKGRGLSPTGLEHIRAECTQAGSVWGPPEGLGTKWSRPQVTGGDVGLCAGSWRGRLVPALNPRAWWPGTGPPEGHSPAVKARRRPRHAGG